MNCSQMVRARAGEDADGALELSRRDCCSAEADDPGRFARLPADPLDPLDHLADQSASRFPHRDSTRAASRFERVAIRH